jgi:hypothetical protein
MRGLGLVSGGIKVRYFAVMWNSCTFRETDAAAEKSIADHTKAAQMRDMFHKRTLIPVCGLALMLLYGLSCSGIKSQQQGIASNAPKTNAMVSKIRTVADPQYVYEYRSTKFVPE